MKTLSIIAASLLFCAAPLFAQTNNITYGRTTITLNQQFAQSIAPTGAVITDLDGHALQNNTLVMRENAGAITPATGQGEATHTGGYIVTAGNMTLRLQDFAINTVNPANAYICAQAIVNGKFYGTVTLFAVQFPANITLPLPVNNGVLQLTGLNLTLTPAASQFINQLYQAQVTQGNEPVGTASTYSVVTSGSTL